MEKLKQINLTFSLILIVVVITTFFIAMPNFYIFIYYLSTIGLLFAIAPTVVIWIIVASVHLKKVKNKEHRTDLRKPVIAIMKAYPKISMVNLATRLEVTPQVAEKVVIDLIARGKLKGHMDPGTGEFISRMVKTGTMIGNELKNITCNECGAVIKTIPVKGTSVKCEACGNLILIS